MLVQWLLLLILCAIQLVILMYVDLPLSWYKRTEPVTQKQSETFDFEPPSNLGTTNPGTVDPGTVDPGTVDPGTTNPSPIAANSVTQWRNYTPSIAADNTETYAGPDTSYTDLQNLHRVTFVPYVNTTSSALLEFRYIRFSLWWNWEMGLSNSIWCYVSVARNDGAQVENIHIQSVSINGDPEQATPDRFF